MPIVIVSLRSVAVSDVKWAHTKIMCVVVVCVFVCVFGVRVGGGGGVGRHTVPLYKLKNNKFDNFIFS